jgi:signal peptidase I
MPPAENENISEPRAPSRSSLLRGVGEFLRLLIIAAAIAIPIRYFIVQPFIVRGASMEPNFYDGQYLIVNELAYFLREPKRGEVVVFHYPLDPREYYIKRIIGLPGESVSIKNGEVVIVNAERPEGFRLDEPYLPEDLPTVGSPIPVKLGPSEFLVLGDNRPFSSDSRTWGLLDKKHITGYALFRAWPPQDFGFIPQPK